MRDILKPTLVLLIVCVVISFFVALTFHMTEDTIKAIEKETNDNLMNQVLPGSNSFDEIDTMIKTHNSNVTINNVYKSTKGYVFNLVTKGYAGDVTVFVGITNEGQINNIQLGKNSETPSVGKKAEEKDFTNKFIEKNTDQNLSEEIDTITGATITTKAVIEAVQEACIYFSSYNETDKEEN